MTGRHPPRRRAVPAGEILHHDGPDRGQDRSGKIGVFPTRLLARDQAPEKRLAVVGDTFGVWRCRTNFNCTNACPREIDVTRAIGEVKKLLLFNRMS